MNAQTEPVSDRTQSTTVQDRITNCAGAIGFTFFGFWWLVSVNMPGLENTPGVISYATAAVLIFRWWGFERKSSSVLLGVSAGFFLLLFVLACLYSVYSAIAFFQH